MSEYLNATCSICGEKYHLCNDCKNTMDFTPWRRIADSVNCYKIFLVLRDYTNKCATKAETKEKLTSCDLSNLETFQENIKESIKNIMAEEKPKRTKKAVQKQPEKDSSFEYNE